MTLWDFDEDGDIDIAVANYGGTGADQKVELTVFDEGPAWSPLIIPGVFTVLGILIAQIPILYKAR